MPRLLPLCSALLSGLLAVHARAALLEPGDYTSLGSLNVSSGTLTINTDTLSMSGAASFTGVLQAQGPGLPSVAVFTFDEIDVAVGATVTITGSRALALLSQGDATIGPSLSVSGLGAAGGAPGIAGSGAGGGGSGSGGGGGGGHLGVGGAGGNAFNNGGPAFGVPGALQIGSGGGGSASAGGAGGGAIEVGAIGALSLSQGAFANGAVGQNVVSLSGAGGGGSGGSIVVHGATVTALLLGANGGPGGRNTADPIFSGSGGGGGGGGSVHVDIAGPVTLASAIVLGSSLPRTGLDGGRGGEATYDGFDGSPGVATLSADRIIVPSGFAQPVHADGSLDVDSNEYSSFETDVIEVKAQGLLYSTAPVATSLTLDLQGGLVSAPFGWALGSTAGVSGYGTLAGPVAAGGRSDIDASGGTLVLGDANRSDGFTTTGSVTIADGATLALLDSDGATLGLFGRLTATGNAFVDGDFVNQGRVVGPGAASQYLTFLDDVSGSGDYSGNILFSDGFSPGNSPAQVSFENVSFDETSELLIELGGTIAGIGYDQILVSGLAELDGALRVVLLSGFAPAVGDVFEILRGGTLAGAFASLSLPESSGGSWRVDSTPTGLSLVFVPEPSPALLVALGLVALAMTGARRS